MEVRWNKKKAAPRVFKIQAQLMPQAKEFNIHRNFSKCTHLDDILVWGTSSYPDLKLTSGAGWVDFAYIPCHHVGSLWIPPTYQRYVS